MVQRAGVECVLVEFSDNGAGIPEDVAAKVFDPFFTTKEKGGGLNIGLGLSISKGIIEKHGATVELDGRAGEGACFRLFFPATQEEELSAGIAG